MNRKLTIRILLLCVLSLFLVGCALKDNSRIGNEDSILKYCIIYQDELGLTYEQILAKIDNAEKDKDLIKRTFEIDRGTGTIILPDIYFVTVNITEKTFEIERIGYENIIVKDSDNVWFNGLKAICNDYYSIEFDDTLYIKLRETYNYSKEICENVTLPVRIIKEPIKVESVDLRLIDETTEIKVNEAKGLRAVVYPLNSSYQETEYKIKKIVLPSGQELTENFSKYAYIIDGRISTTTDIPIGSKIYISAVALHDDVESNILCLDVVRTPVTNFQLVSSTYGTGIQFGETLKLNLDIYPYNATANILNDEPIIVELLNTELGVLNKISDKTYTLTATSDLSYLREEININVSVGNLTKIFTFRIGNIPVNSVTIYDKETNVPLSQNIGLLPGGALKVYTVIDPIEASIYDVVYSKFSTTMGSGNYVSITEDGEITISPNAPVGMEVYLTASAKQVNSISHKITIQKIPVDYVELRIAGGLDSIALDQKLVLSAYIYPLNASNRTVEFKLLNEYELTGVTLPPMEYYRLAQIPRSVKKL